jgi:hypothetical protein
MISPTKEKKKKKRKREPNASFHEPCFRRIISSQSSHVVMIVVTEGTLARVISIPRSLLQGAAAEGTAEGAAFDILIGIERVGEENSLSFPFPFSLFAEEEFSYSLPLYSFDASCRLPRISSLQDLFRALE